MSDSRKLSGLKNEGDKGGGLSSSPLPLGFKRKDVKVMKKPTIAEIEAYCKDRGNDIDAEAFFHHYESIGWVRVIGKAEIKIKSWKSVIVTWEKRNNCRKFVHDPPQPEEEDMCEKINRMVAEEEKNA